MTQNKYNLQVGDKIRIGSFSPNAVTKVTDEGISFDQERYTWPFEEINKRIENKAFWIVERAKKSFPEKWSVEGGESFEEFLKDARKEGLAIAGCGGFNKIYNFTNLEHISFGYRKDFKLVTVDQLREHYLNTKQEMQKDKKIIGYKCPTDLFGGEIIEGTLFITLNNPYIYGPTESKVPPSRDVNNIMSMPKEIVETWEPVYKEEEVKLTLGNPAKEIVIKRDGAYYNNKKFDHNYLREVRELFKSIPGRNMHIKKVWIGCENGSEFTKSEILKIIKTAEEL